jgi:hypothetical protein
MRDLACGDCVVTMLLETEEPLGGTLDLDDAERRAVDLLAAGGLISPLRLVPLRAETTANPGKRRIA